MYLCQIVHQSRIVLDSSSKFIVSSKYHNGMRIIISLSQLNHSLYANTIVIHLRKMQMDRPELIINTLLAEVSWPWTLPSKIDFNSTLKSLAGWTTHQIELANH